MTARAPQPAMGERVATRDQTLTRGPWSAGTPPLTTSEDATGTARRLFGQLRPERTRLALVALALVISVSLTVYGPRLLGQATDVIIDGVIAGDGLDRTELGRVLGTAVGVYVVGALLSWMAAHTMAGVVQRTMSRLRSAVEDKVHRLPLSTVDRTPRGDLLSRVTNDIDNMAQSLQMSVSQSLNQVLMLVGVVAMMIWISPLLAVFAVLLIPTSLRLVKAISKRSRLRFMDQWRATGDLNGLVEESFTGHAVVKVFGRQAAVEERFAAINDDLHEASWRAQLAIGVTQPIMMFLGNLNYLIVAVLGAIRITGGGMTVGELQAFIQYARLYTQPLAAIAGMLNMIQSGLASAERVFELLDWDEEHEDSAAPAALGQVEGRVAFEDVSFSYDPDVALIEGLSLVAEPGRTVAIVGPTGAGKTTLVNLVMRFYDVDGGAITVEGVDVRSLPRAELRRHIGMVLQDTWLLEASIWENLRYGRPDATDEEVLEAARIAYVDRFVHALPDGYQTVIAEDGGNLSAGEKQLITIARAFLDDPPILILDEATSSVDTRTEVLVQEAMAALRSRRTSFVIAHRLSTIRDADTIVMMEDGRIVEQGSHEALIAAGGAYLRLYESQFRAPVIDPDEDPGPRPSPPRPQGRPAMPL